MPGIKIAGDDHFKTWQHCGAYYQCPKDADGKRLGPLVGYAGEYTSPNGEKKHYVGEEYFNPAKVEEQAYILAHFAQSLAFHISYRMEGRPVFLGAPMGGIRFAGELCREIGLECRAIFAEKQITRLATCNQREESILVLKRHKLWPNDNVIIVEDVCHDFSAIDKIIDLVKIHRADVIGIACLVNELKEEFYQILPIFSLIRRPLDQYTQEDPMVIDDISQGNIVWKPQDNWDQLEAIMQS